MERDIGRGAPVEADRILGCLLRRSGGQAHDRPILHLVYAHAKSYETRRTRDRVAQ
jgi:2-dehydropantoate 2-reductase